MSLGDPARDRQAEPCADAAARGVELDEAVEDSCLIRRRNARALVADADADGAGIMMQLHPDRSTLGRVLHGILQDVQHEAPQKVLVAANNPPRLFTVGKVMMAGKLRQRLTAHNISIINKISGTILVVFGLALIYGVVFLSDKVK